MPTFQGEEFLINDTTAGYQDHPTQTVLGNGNILVTWESGESFGASTDAHARILNPDGTVSAPDFAINTAAGLSGAVTATTLSNGDALMTWSSGADTLARVVDPQGHLGPEIVVNSGGSESSASAVTLADGNVMLLSTALTNIGGAEISGHILNASGTPTGSFTVPFSGNQVDPAVTAMADGNAFVTWIDGNSHVMYGQVLNPDGSAHAPYFQVDPNAAGQFELQPTALSNCDVLVTWDENDGVHGQIVHPGSGTSGSDFLISAPGSQSANESVIALADGRAIAVWQSGGHIDARVINADGGMDAQFVVDSASGRSTLDPHVTQLPNGEIFVSWNSTSSNLDGDIHGRLITLDHTISGTPGNDTLNGTDGNDIIYGGDGNDNLIGGAGDDILSGGTGHNFLWGNDGNDTFIAGPGADTFAGGNGIDTVLYEHSNAGVTVDLRAGTATSNGDGNGDIFTSIENIVGSSHNDMLIGDAAANHLDGGAGNDRIWGGDGNDILTGGHGADVLAGGAGSDTVDYSTSDSGVTINLATGAASGGDATGDTFTSIENVTGSAHNDQLVGDAGANHLDGGAGHDLIWGGDGNDILTGGHGADVLAGGSGSDTLDYGTSDIGVSVNLATGAANGGDATGDTFSSIENLTGSAHNDQLTGDAGANHIDGGAGNDLIWGGDGNDTLVGGSGADTLAGGAGIDTADYSASQGKVTVDLGLGTGSGGDAQGDTLTSIDNVTGSVFDDHLTGNSGANQLFGGAGADVLTGGAGADMFVFKTAQDSTAAHQDQITDFSSAQGDHIDLSAIDANAQLAGHQDFGFIGNAAFSDVAGQLRYDGHLLEGDVNGDGVADFSVHVNVATLHQSDFIL